MEEGKNSLNSMDIYEVLEHLPHRYPFLLVDRVIDYKEGEYLNALKNVSFNEPYFTGHFPHRPVMPGVLILEALAQATGILAYKSTGTKPSAKSLYYFVSIDKGRFKAPVEPGDQLHLEVKVLKNKRGFWKCDGKAYVDGKVVCEAELMCAERDV